MLFKIWKLVKNFVVFHKCAVEADRAYYEDIDEADNRSWGLTVLSRLRVNYGMEGSL